MVFQKIDLYSEDLNEKLRQLVLMKDPFAQLTFNVSQYAYDVLAAKYSALVQSL